MTDELYGEVDYAFLQENSHIPVFNDIKMHVINGRKVKLFTGSISFTVVEHFNFFKGKPIYV